MYFIHSIQTYASVNRKGSELQEYVLQLKDSLIKNREFLPDNLICIISITKVRNLLGEGTGFFPRAKTGGKG